MTPEQVHLLRALGSGIRPVDLGEIAPVNEDRFGTMLRDAIDGRAHSELGVTFAPSASGMFNQRQQQRIARAIDLAAAAGSEHALILHERHTLRVDVRNRVVLEAPRLAAEDAITGIDSFVSAQVPAEQSDEPDFSIVSSGVLRPARVVRNASLVRTLAQAEPMHDS